MMGRRADPVLENLDRLRKFDADFTPAPIVHQGLTWTSRHLPTVPDQILDPSAGAGVFGEQSGAVWPHARRHGIEIRAEERRFLRRHYESHAIDSFLTWAMEAQSGGFAADLIATNPPFSLVYDYIRLCHRLVAPGGVVQFLGLTTWGQSAEGVKVFSRYPPAFQLRVGGRVGYRGPGNNPKTGKPWGVDLRDYSWWIWVPHRPPDRFNGEPYWRTIQLPVLPTPDRAWRRRPGTTI